MAKCIMHCLFFICVFLSSKPKGIYGTDILKDMAGSWEEPWKHVVEDVGNIDEHLNKLPQDHPYIIETIQDNFILKPHLDTVRMNKRTNVDNPVSAARVFMEKGSNSHNFIEDQLSYTGPIQAGRHCDGNIGMGKERRNIF